jgi:NAD+ kinase
MKAFAITPISPHQLTQRPLVVGADTEIRVEIDSENPVVATFDGQSWFDFQCGDVLRVRQATVPALIFSTGGRTYFEMLRTKLRWGDSE